MDISLKNKPTISQVGMLLYITWFFVNVPTDANEMTMPARQISLLLENVNDDFNQIWIDRCNIERKLAPRPIENPKVIALRAKSLSDTKKTELTLTIIVDGKEPVEATGMLTETPEELKSDFSSAPESVRAFAQEFSEYLCFTLCSDERYERFDHLPLAQLIC